MRVFGEKRKRSKGSFTSHVSPPISYRMRMRALAEEPRPMNNLESRDGERAEEAEQSSMAASAMDGVAAAALRSVLHRVQQAAERSGRGPHQIRVVAVSKTKSVSLIREVYDSGHRCFGENYVQEIIEKAPQVH